MMLNAVNTRGIYLDLGHTRILIVVPLYSMDQGSSPPAATAAPSPGDQMLYGWVMDGSAVGKEGMIGGSTTHTHTHTHTHRQTTNLI